MARNLAARHSRSRAARTFLKAKASSRGKTSDPSPLHPRGRPRLPVPRPESRRRSGRPCPVTPTVQRAAADGGGLERPTTRVARLLPRDGRNLARGSPAGVHPVYIEVTFSWSRRRSLTSTNAPIRRESGRTAKGIELAAAPSPASPGRGDGSLRHRPPRQPRYGLELVDVSGHCHALRLSRCSPLCRGAGGP